MASPTLILLLVGFLDTMAVALILPHLDIHAKKLEFNYIQLGLVGAVFSGCQMISSPIVGSLSDVIGRKSILLLCLTICSFCYFCLGITSSIIVFLSLRGVIGAFKQTQLLTRALAPDYIKDPNKVLVLYARLISLGSLGLALGPVVSGHIMEAFPQSGFTIVCAIISAIFILNSGLINSLPEISNEKNEHMKGPSKELKLFESISDTFKQFIHNLYIVDLSKYWDIFLFKLLFSLTVGLYFSNYGLLLTTQHGLSPIYLGYIAGFQGVIGSIGSNSVVFVNKLYINDKDCSQRIFHIFSIMAVSLTGLALVPGIYIYIVILIPQTICFALSRIVNLEVVRSRSGTGNRGTLIGVLNSVRSIAGIMTPIISGFINQYLGVTYTFLAGALFATIGLVISYRLKSRSVQEKIK